MAVMENRDLEVFGLNPEHVGYFRRVRDLLTPFNETEIRELLARLREIARGVDLHVQEFVSVADHLIRIGYYPYDLQWMYFRNNGRHQWQVPIPAIKNRSSAEEWTSRPDLTHLQALTAWNGFVTALEQQPLRIYRTATKKENDWAGEFLRKDGSKMFVGLSELKEGPRVPSGEGFLSAASLTEIVEDMGNWVDGRSPAARE